MSLVRRTVSLRFSCRSSSFTEAGSAYDAAVAKRLRDHVFKVGNTIDPAETYRAFRGRDPGIDALLRKRGFPVPKAAAPK